MVDDLKMLFLISEKIFKVYTNIKLNIYNHRSNKSNFEELNLLITLEKNELSKIKNEYEEIDYLKEKIVEDNPDYNFNDWNVEVNFIMDNLIGSQERNIMGTNLFSYDEASKKKIIALRVYQNLNLLQTECLDYPFEDLDALISEGNLELDDNYNFYIDDIEKATGIYSDNPELDDLEFDNYIKEALKKDYVLALNPAFRDRLFLEVKADYLLNCYRIYAEDKNKGLDLENFYIDSMINILFIYPLLEQRMLINQDGYYSTDFYTYRSNLKFLNMIEKREFKRIFINYLQFFIDYYDDYNINNFYSYFKDKNIITEFANINMIISNIKACFINKNRNDLLYYVNDFMISNEKEDNKKLFSMLMREIGNQEKMVRKLDK